MEQLLRDVPDYIKELVPYPPGKPRDELEREYGIKDSVKLASNENDLGPSPRAVERIRGILGELHRYPDGSCYYLKHALAERFDVMASNIVLGNGSNELIDFLCRIFIRKGRNAISSRPSFLVYNKMVQINGGENRVVPLKDSTHDLDSIAARVDRNTRLIFLDNPNNPMGTVIRKKDLEAFLSKLPSHLLVVLDEAYGEFVRPETDWAEGRSFFPADERVVILRTFSKAYGLAGLRVGYGIMHEDIAALCDRVRQPFNVNLPAQEGALSALSDRDHLESTLENTWNEMIKLFNEIQELGCIPFESNTNFMLIDTCRQAKEVFEAMLRKGVIIRSMDSYGFPTYVRITVGTPEENQKFLQAFSRVLEEIPEIQGRV